MTHATLPASDIAKAARARIAENDAQWNAINGGGYNRELGERLRTLWLLASSHEAAGHREMTIDRDDFALIAEDYAKAQGWTVPPGPWAKP